MGRCRRTQEPQGHVTTTEEVPIEASTVSPVVVTLREPRSAEERDGWVLARSDARAVRCCDCGATTPGADQFYSGRGVQCLDCHLAEEQLSVTPPSWPKLLVSAVATSLMPAWVSWFVVSLAQLAFEGGVDGYMAVEMVVIMSFALSVLAITMAATGLAEVRQVLTGAAASIEPDRVRWLHGLSGAWWALNGLGSVGLLIALVGWVVV